MKDYLIKKGQLILAVLPLANTLLLTLLFLIAVRQQGQIQTLKTNTGCSYFINVAEYSKGSVEYFCTVSDYHSAKQIELEYKRQVQSQMIGPCQYGQCLDSAEVTLYRDCSENYDIEIYRDTTIYY